jgi:hypothetical protein
VDFSFVMIVATKSSGNLSSCPLNQTLPMHATRCGHSAMCCRRCLSRCKWWNKSSRGLLLILSQFILPFLKISAYFLCQSTLFFSSPTEAATVEATSSSFLVLGTYVDTTFIKRYSCFRFVLLIKIGIRCCPFGTCIFSQLLNDEARPDRTVRIHVPKGQELILIPLNKNDKHTKNKYGFIPRLLASFKGPLNLCHRM